MCRGWLAPVIGATVLLTGCGLKSTAGSSGRSGSRVEVVAAENSWGSIASQLGGDHVHVVSIIANPATDPHAYEAKPDDAKAIARAQYVISNGAGYDPWVDKLASANPVWGRRQLVIAELLGKREGDNPHFWYSPVYFDRVIDRVTADLKKIDSADAPYFDQQNASYKTNGLKEYTDTIAMIKQRYHGVHVGATESIFAYLAEPLGLDLVTPPEYMKAISDGTDPSAADKVILDDQIANKEIRVFVFNSQNTTPDVKAIVDRAKAKGIPVTAVTETMTPASTSYQEWQTAQLKSLLKALGG